MKTTFYSTFAHTYSEGLELRDLSFTFYEMVYYINGQGTTTINGSTYTYGSHTICLTKPGDVRDCFCSKAADYTAIRFGLTNLNFDLNSGIYACQSTDFLELFLAIKNEATQKNLNYFEVCNSLISVILQRLPRMQPIDPNDAAFLNLLKKIDQTPDYNPSIQEMAASVAYSYDHFRRKFKQITGQPPTQYIINNRIGHACILLQTTTHSCTKISQICGFSSSPQFSALFKKVNGVTPSEFRQYYC